VAIERPSTADNTDCRSDQRVAVKQRGADDAKKDDNHALAAECATGERHQNGVPFAIIVGTQQDQHV
jgi:hypothetical protein